MALNNLLKTPTKWISNYAAALFPTDITKPVRKEQGVQHIEGSAPVFLTGRKGATSLVAAHNKSPSKPKPYCPHSDTSDHYLNSCDSYST